MKNKLNKFAHRIVLASTVFITTAFLCTQSSYGLDLKSFAGSKSKNKTQKSAFIKSNSMDIDVNNNVAKLTGDVFIDHPDMTLKCDKMIINLQDKPKEKKKKAAEKSQEDNNGDTKKAKNTSKSAAAVSNFSLGGNSKEVSTIVCIGNVIITKKVFDEKDKANGPQTAKANKAVFDVPKSIITLTENNPVISMRENSISGKIITIYIDENRMKVDGNSVIKYDVNDNEKRQEFLKQNPNVPKKPTIIKSDSSDININKNIAHLVGSVHIDDAMADLKCNNMDIYLTDDQQLASTEASSIPYFPIDGKNKTVDQIVCVGDVVIKRNLYSEGDIAAGEQKATSQKAVFTNEDSLLLLAKVKDVRPIISRGDTLASGDTIAVNLKTETVKFTGFSAEIPQADIDNFNKK
ncbi:LptA/OstA family protein [Lentisphaerota bacterium WC36G]|nr:hypothetical protein LJT99_14260 [Lentisphaerae bacterium WC36]